MNKIYSMIVWHKAGKIAAGGCGKINQKRKVRLLIISEDASENKEVWQCYRIL